jgi:hypothetical protein
VSLAHPGVPGAVLAAGLLLYMCTLLVLLAWPAAALAMAGVLFTRWDA